MRYKITASDGNTYQTDIDIQQDALLRWVPAIGADGSRVYVYREAVVAVCEINPPAWPGNDEEEPAQLPKRRGRPAREVKG